MTVALNVPPRPADALEGEIDNPAGVVALTGAAGIANRNVASIMATCARFFFCTF